MKFYAGYKIQCLMQQIVYRLFNQHICFNLHSSLLSNERLILASVWQIFLVSFIRYIFGSLQVRVSVFSILQKYCSAIERQQCIECLVFNFY